jgi:ribose 5-phosphate isomerase
MRDPDLVATRLDGIPGLAEHGLFLGMTEVLIVGEKTGGTRTFHPPPHRTP